MTLSEEKVMDIIKESNVSLLSVAYSTRSVETVSIQRLPVFLSAAEHLNFTRAAEEQCISQTAVSQQIKLLEQELGYALFVRGKRGVSLTPAGEVFYRQCKQLMIRYNDAAAQGKKIALGNATDLRIGYAGAYELWTIVSQIRKYHRQHPEAEIEFQLGSNQSLLGALAEGQLDMAVLSGFGVELGKGLDSRVTLSDPCMVMISASHPLAEKQTIHPRELKGMPIVLNRAQDSQPSAGLIAGMYANMGLRDNKRMYADDFYSIALIINTGIAFSIMPASMADWGISGVVFRPLHGFRAKARTLLVYPRGSQDTGIRSFVSLIKPKRGGEKKKRPPAGGRAGGGGGGGNLLFVRHLARTSFRIAPASTSAPATVVIV